MPITPPLDRIPSIPGRLMGLINEQISKQIDVLSESVSETLQQSTKLPEGVNCDDPKVQRIKNSLESLSKQIENLNKLIPVINQVKTAMTVAATAAQAIKAAQLLNPITGPAALAAELLLVQNMTITNAIQATTQLQNIPNQLQSSLQSISADIALTLQNFSNVCNNESFKFPDSVNSELNKLNNQFNDDLDSEFYQTENVQQEDIDERNDLIQQLVETQTDLLSSLQEAPSQVYSDTGDPDSNLGKPGDYYIDTENKIIYGPKVSRTEWPQGVNY